MDQVFNRVARRRRQGQQGFTLIELLVVIAVLAILAAIVLFNIVGVANRGKSSACQTDKQTIQTAVDGYYNDKGVYADQAGDTATPANLDKVDYTELTSDNLIHSTPAEQFTYTGSTGTIGGGGC